MSFYVGFVYVQYVCICCGAWWWYSSLYVRSLNNVLGKYFETLFVFTIQMWFRFARKNKWDKINISIDYIRHWESIWKAKYFSLYLPLIHRGLKYTHKVNSHYDNVSKDIPYIVSMLVFPYNLDFSKHHKIGCFISLAILIQFTPPD